MAAKLPPAVTSAMAMRDVRIHHWLFHTVRDGWRFFTPAQRTKLKAMGWEPPRPALGGTIDNQQPDLANDSGEDFLYMHSEMIEHVNKILAQAGQADYLRIEGWKQLPRPGDAEYPVPPAWTSGNSRLDSYLKRVKSDGAFARFQQWEADYTDLDKLRSWTLGQLGSMIEYTIHNQMHMRWCANPGQFRDAGGLFDTIDTRWDAPSYDWLGDTYSSHVNPVFWKLHGWIDDRIDDWRKANKVDTIVWKGTWMGPQGHGGHVHTKAATALPVDVEAADALRAAVAVVGQGEFRHQLWNRVELPSSGSGSDAHFAMKSVLPMNAAADVNEEILAGVKGAIMRLSIATADQIALKSKIKTFIPPLVGGAFVAEIVTLFPQVSAGDLQAALFEDITTVGDLVDFIAEASDA